MTEGSRVGEGGTRASLTRRMELTDSVMCRRLISVSSLHRSKAGWAQCQAPTPACPVPKGLPAPMPLRLLLMFLPRLGL